ncbi:MAG: hypothetical protein U9R43_01125 [Thermodesulfobacteriota bacterium]|nr:hypothetical protein [Thermodesulfobacteriota bacterium]
MNFTGTFKSWSDVLFTSATALFSKLANLLPNLIGALLLLFLGWLAAKLCRRLALKILKWTGFERVMERSRINETIKTAGITTSIGDVIAIVVFWSIFLIFVVSASEVLGLSVVLSTLNRLILYIPNIIASIAIIVLTLFLARFVKDLIAVSLAQINSIYARPLARTVELLIIIFGFIVATTQLGFDIGILMANITLFIGGFVGIVVLSMGLGAKTVVENLLAGYYVRQLFNQDQDVILAGEKGRIKKIHNLGIIMETESGEIMVPNHKIVDKGSFK